MAKSDLEYYGPDDEKMTLKIIAYLLKSEGKDSALRYIERRLNNL